MTAHSGSERDDFWRQWRPAMRRTVSAYNQIIADHSRQSRPAGLPPTLELMTLVCECCRHDCDAQILVESLEFQRVRLNPRGLLVAPGHETQDDRVLEITPRYTIIETLEEEPPLHRPE